MRFAIVQGRRQEAQPGLSAQCPICDSLMVAKCGTRRVWHWAHRGRRTCDHWWEPESEWHRAWKAEFPVDWQEVIQWAKDGEKHIADVKTNHGWVIEFQHSYLRPEERQAREAFYRQMVWVVNGRRRKRDWSSFEKARELARVVSLNPFAQAFPADEFALLRDWADSRVAVYFDFRDPVLWCLLPRRQGGMVFLAPVTRIDFLNAFRTGVAPRGMDFTKLMKRAQAAPRPPHLPSRGREDFRQYLRRKYSARSQRRL